MAFPYIIFPRKEIKLFFAEFFIFHGVFYFCGRAHIFIKIIEKMELVHRTPRDHEVLLTWVSECSKLPGDLVELVLEYLVKYNIFETQSKISDINEPYEILPAYFMHKIYDVVSPVYFFEEVFREEVELYYKEHPNATACTCEVVLKTFKKESKNGDLFRISKGDILYTYGKWMKKRKISCLTCKKRCRGLVQFLSFRKKFLKKNCIAEFPATKEFLENFPYVEFEDDSKCYITNGKHFGFSTNYYFICEITFVVEKY